MLALTDESLARVMIAATAIAPHARDGCSSSRPRSSTRRRRRGGDGRVRQVMAAREPPAAS